jgi:hypothetical protein
MGRIMKWGACQVLVLRLGRTHGAMRARLGAGTAAGGPAHKRRYTGITRRSDIKGGNRTAPPLVVAVTATDNSQ